ncbi:hypothetical protein FRC17_001419 [Serendipita sp. 399]|nr:hypothetical protein FRC17_001419 [Serendipita sp. 399]
MSKMLQFSVDSDDEIEIDSDSFDLGGEREAHCFIDAQKAAYICADLSSRVIGIIEIGPLNLPTHSVTIAPQGTYDDLCNQLGENRENLVVLAADFGPYPCFHHVVSVDVIPSSVRRVWVMERNESTSIVVVRTLDEDVILPITLLESDNRSLMRDVIIPALVTYGCSPFSIKDHSGRKNIQYQTVESVKAALSADNPTIAFAETILETFEFRTKFKDSVVAEAWKFLHTRGSSLVQQASHATSKPLLLIHLARALLHLIVSAQEDEYNDESTHRTNNCTELHQLLDGLEDRVDSSDYSESDSDQDFRSLCGDFPGAVAVRQSYTTFLKLKNPLHPSHRPLVASLSPSSIKMETIDHDPQNFKRQVHADSSYKRKVLRQEEESALDRTKKAQVLVILTDLTQKSDRPTLSVYPHSTGYSGPRGCRPESSEGSTSLSQDPSDRNHRGRLPIYMGKEAKDDWTIHPNHALSVNRMPNEEIDHFTGSVIFHPNHALSVNRMPNEEKDRFTESVISIVDHQDDFFEVLRKARTEELSNENRKKMMETAPPQALLQHEGDKNPFSYDSQARQWYPRAAQHYSGTSDLPHTILPIPSTPSLFDMHRSSRSVDNSTASSSNPLVCPLCAAFFSRQDRLEDHMNIHNGSKPYACEGGCGINNCALAELGPKPAL